MRSETGSPTEPEQIPGEEDAKEATGTGRPSDKTNLYAGMLPALTMAQQGRNKNPGEATMSIGKIRNLLYQLARILGDINAIRRGKVSQRIGRRIAGKATGRFLGRLFR